MKPASRRNLRRNVWPNNRLAGDLAQSYPANRAAAFVPRDLQYGFTQLQGSALLWSLDIGGDGKAVGHAAGYPKMFEEPALGIVFAARLRVFLDQRPKFGYGHA